MRSKSIADNQLPDRGLSKEFMEALHRVPGQEIIVRGSAAGSDSPIGMWSIDRLAPSASLAALSGRLRELLEIPNSPLAATLLKLPKPKTMRVPDLGPSRKRKHTDSKQSEDRNSKRPQQQSSPQLLELESGCDDLIQNLGETAELRAFLQENQERISDFLESLKSPRTSGTSNLLSELLALKAKSRKLDEDIADRFARIAQFSGQLRPVDSKTPLVDLDPAPMLSSHDGFPMRSSSSQSQPQPGLRHDLDVTPSVEPGSQNGRPLDEMWPLMKEFLARNPSGLEHWIKQVRDVEWTQAVQITKRFEQAGCIEKTGPGTWAISGEASRLSCVEVSRLLNNTPSRKMVRARQLRYYQKHRKELKERKERQQVLLSSTSTDSTEPPR